MALCITNLSKRYNQQLALDQINLKINSNEIVGLLGPNGAGKSTLMKSISGVLKIDDGEIVLNDRSIKQNPIECKRMIGFLPENNPLYQDMYVKEYLNFVAKIHRIPSQKVESIIEQTGITPEKNKKIQQLSKGYKQRVGIAQAILHNPNLLILDEPTNGLDPNQILEIRQLIRTLSKNKMVILSTHIMQEVEALCTRVILILHGKILQDGPIEDFRGKFQSMEDAFSAYTFSE